MEQLNSKCLHLSIFHQHHCQQKLHFQEDSSLSKKITLHFMNSIAFLHIFQLDENIWRDCKSTQHV